MNLNRRERRERRSEIQTSVASVISCKKSGEVAPPEFGDIERAAWEAGLPDDARTDPEPLIGSHTR